MQRSTDDVMAGFRLYSFINTKLKKDGKSTWINNWIGETMPLDNANFINQLNPTNPNGAIDTVNMLDDSIREVKRAIVNTLPNLDKQVVFSADELNALQVNFKYDATNGFNANAKVIDNVVSKDSDKAVEPRKYNDERYLKQESNLSDLKDKNKALGALATGIDYTNADLKIFQKMIVNMMYPVGCVYTNIDGSNPRDRLGEGTWERMAQGRTLIGEGTLNDGTEQKGFNGGVTGGKFSHTLTTAQLPAHSHSTSWGLYSESGGENNKMASGAGGKENDFKLSTDNTGGGEAFNILQPYLVVYFWKRTA